MPIDLIAIDSPLPAIALRSVLECWGCQVQTYFIGDTRQLVALLSTPSERAPCIVLECHGVREGIALPDFAPAVEVLQPYHQVLTPVDLHAFLRLPMSTVINTGCSLGTLPFAQAFLASGAQAYIGAEGDPSGDAALLYLLRLFYGLQCQHLPLADAHKQAHQQASETTLFRLFAPEPAAN